MTESHVQIPDDIAALSFEEALEKLRELVGKVEKGETSLDDAIDAYAKGSALRQHCQYKLSEAKAKIEQLTFGPDGKPDGAEEMKL